ncbi:peroxisome biogenesis factor 2-like [Clytia hemisphaerica]|uniref:peroxisome biogenesis factor 2-like n=1 Tax=Clytia hemisphaerica TaxID=252671 RepID=UPI0034D47A86
MSKNEKQEKYKVLRVTQLDAEQIDSSIFSLLKDSLVNSLKAEPFCKLLNFEPELSVSLQAVLWYFSVYKHGKTVGQNMLGTELVGVNGRKINNIQCYGLLFAIFIQWFKNRESLWVKLMDKMDLNGTSLMRIFKYIESCSEIIVYVNMLLFLTSGNHVSVIERCLNLKHVYTNKPYPRYIDYDYIRKEMVWDTTTKTMLCLLPLINFKKISYHLNRFFNSKKLILKDDNTEVHLSMSCCLCNETLTNPYQVGCPHWYCYYCLMANFIDGSFTCILCGMVTETFKPVIFQKR